jgi:N-acetylglucosamine kinase-like BadF-type ATPase
MYVVGVDGGTTKTIALIGDGEGRIISAARGGGSNWTGEDVEIPMAVVVETVQEALQKANLSGEDIETGVFTLAGADWPEDHTRREAVLRQAGIARKVIVKNDSFGGLRAGLSRPYGMVLAVGTGMNAAVITPDGTEWAFGYYETFGGSGTIARDTFEALLRAEDGRGQPTSLTRAVLERLEFPTVEALLRASILRQIDYGKFYSITPLVFEQALAGDPIAVGIIVRQGKGLAEYVTAMARRFDMTRLEFEVVLAGSVFKGVGPLLIDTIVQEVHQVAPYAKAVRARFEPAVGSVLLALDALDIDVNDMVYSKLAQTTPEPAFFDTAKGSRPTPIRQEAE